MNSLRSSRQDEDLVVRRRGENVTSVVFSVVAALLVQMLPNWNIGFVTSELPVVLTAVTLSLVIDAGSHLTLAFHSPRYLHHALHALMAGFSLNAARVVYEVFPFDFSAIEALPVAGIVRGGLIFAMAVSGISLVVNGLRFLFARKR